MNIYDEAIEKIGKNKTIQFVCKHDKLDVDFTPKTMECFVDILHNDENSYHEETESYNYEEQSEKDVAFFEGETVQYGDYKCYIKIIDDVVFKALTRAKKVEGLLDLYRLQQEYRKRHTAELRSWRRQQILDSIEEIAEEIYLKEKELEEQK